MKFAARISLRNIQRKPLRSAATALLVMLLSFTVFAGAYTIISLRNGLASYKARLGADIIVIPSSASSHGTVDDILLQGITGNYYMKAGECDKIRATEGIEGMTAQFFLTSAKASCCSSRVQIIGFDPDTDFSVTPWIAESYSGELADGDVIVGSNISVPETKKVTFYGQDYHVAAQLAETGTGLDSAVYTNMATIKQMAKNAKSLLKTSAFKGVDIDTAASAILIRVADGYEISDVADDINIHITKVKASPARTMISDISAGLESVSTVIGALVGIIWLLSLVILIAVFVLLSNERRKEFAVLRVMGASRKMLTRIMGLEALMISAAGSAAGIVFALLMISPLSGSLREALGLPFLAPGTSTLALLAAGAALISVLAGLVSALASSGRITGSETGLLLREDT